MDASERYALTAFCEELADLRQECARQPEQRRLLLARIEAEAQARRPILELLGELLGTTSDDTVRSLGTGLPSAGPGRADEERFACPDHACARIAFTVPAGPIPRCRITGEPMIRQ